MVGAHEIVPLDQHRLPLPRLLDEQAVLVQVKRHDRLGPHVDKVTARVRLDAHREVGIRVDVPHAAAEDGGRAVQRPEAGVACPRNLPPVCRQL